MYLSLSAITPLWYEKGGSRGGGERQGGNNNSLLTETQEAATSIWRGRLGRRGREAAQRSAGMFAFKAAALPDQTVLRVNSILF